jgi:hypothetical protein
MNPHMQCQRSRSFISIAVVGALSLLTAPQIASAITFGQYSIQTPALASFNGTIYIAWAGTDPGHTLNVAHAVNGAFTTPVTPFKGGNNTNDGPALVAFNGRLYLAWTGTDSGHTLNVASSPDGVSFDPPVTPYKGQGQNSDWGPALASFNGRLYLAWTGTDSGHTLNVASSPDGVNFDAPALPFRGGVNTDSAPALAVGGTPEELFLAWTGTDPNHHINVAASTNGVSFSSLFIGQGAFQGPALAGLAPTDDLLFLFWSGTDPNHTLNGAYLTTDTGTLTIVTQGGASKLGPAVATLDDVVYQAWIGTDPKMSINSSSPLP